MLASYLQKGARVELARLIGKFWPLLLVAVGLYLLWEWYRQGRQP